ncbi:hypothetical protein DITRI_Ditri01bG0007800 [Diplodiscus trichospermus]
MQATYCYSSLAFPSHRSNWNYSFNFRCSSSKPDWCSGAPRLLAAIANDDNLPVLNYFKVADGSEPYTATLFTAIICMGCVIIGIKKCFSKCIIEDQHLETFGCFQTK